jgi:hypothetical protein
MLRILENEILDVREYRRKVLKVRRRRADIIFYKRSFSGRKSRKGEASITGGLSAEY